MTTPIFVNYLRNLDAIKHDKKKSSKLLFEDCMEGILQIKTVALNFTGHDNDFSYFLYKTYYRGKKLAPIVF